MKDYIMKFEKVYLVLNIKKLMLWLFLRCPLCIS